jgi:SET domain-containing protein
MIKFDYVIWNLMVIEDIKEGEELTVKYEWYKPRERVVL